MESEYRSYLDYIKDPELKKKLIPDYNLGCTRIPKSDKNYYEAVQPMHISSRERSPVSHLTASSWRTGLTSRSTFWSTPPASMRTPICGR